jgi:16S rRNA (cytosine1402-N4)-methyltransferase
VIDCTFGQGGHSTLILDRIGPSGRLLAIDRDPAAVEWGKNLASSSGAEFQIRQANFDQVDLLVQDARITRVDGAILDLGFSSVQVDDGQRGLSFRTDGPLDMRLDPAAPESAADILNNRSQVELTKIIRQLGEERWASRIAERIVRDRPLSSTMELVKVVEGAIPRGAWPRDISVATRTFQAIRIAVNDELGSIERALPKLGQLLSPGGRLVVISFHSLEDRIVKTFMAQESRDCICPPVQPVCQCGHLATLKVLTRKPVRPTLEEVARNPRARSAKLRAAQKL